MVVGIEAFLGFFFALSRWLILMDDFDKECMIVGPKFGLKWVPIFASLVCDYYQEYKINGKSM